MHRDQCQTLLLVPCLMYLCRTKGFCTVLKASHDEQLHDVTCASLEAFPFFCVVTSCIVMSIAWCNLRVEMGMCYCWQCQSVALSDSATVAEHLWLVVTTTVWKPVQSHLHTACSWQIPAWSDPVYQINTQTSNPVNIVHIHRDQCQTPALWSLALATYTRYMHNNIMHMCESRHPQTASGASTGAAIVPANKSGPWSVETHWGDRRVTEQRPFVQKSLFEKCVFVSDDADWCRWSGLRTIHALAWLCLLLLGIPSFWFLLKPGSECM